MAEMETPKKENKKKGIREVIIVVCALILIGCVVYLVRDYMAKQEAERRFQELAQNAIVVNTETETETEVAETETETEEPDLLVELGIEVPELELDWAALAE